MSAQVLAFVLGRASFDAGFRRRLDRDPRAALWGYALSGAGVDANIARDAEALVRPLLTRLLSFPGVAVLPLTVYDAVYPATPELGGHWTVSAVWVGPFAHTTWTYTVAVAFDAAGEPDHFVITGAREIVTRDA